MKDFTEKAAGTAKVLGEVAKEIVDYTVKKANQGSKYFRLQISLTALKKLLSVQYRELGMLVYEMHGRSLSAEDETASIIAQITYTKRKIIAVEHRIQEVLELIRCPRCGSVVKIKNAFCSHCGCKLAAEEEQMEENENEMVYQDNDEEEADT